MIPANYTLLLHTNISGVGGELNGLQFIPKAEVHLTVIGFKVGGLIKKAVKEKPELLEQTPNRLIIHLRMSSTGFVRATYNSYWN